MAKKKHTAPAPEAPTAAAEWEAELRWLTAVIDARFKLYFNLQPEVADVRAIAPPDLSGSATPYAALLRETSAGFEERVALGLAIAPHLRPQLLDVFFSKNQTFDRPFTEFGGLREGRHAGFLPTLETLLFVLAGIDTDLRVAALTRFSRRHPLVQERILSLGEPAAVQLPAEAALQLGDEGYATLVLGQAYRPEFGAHFPAQAIHTRLEWDDLVLHPATRRQLEDIATWSRHGQTLLQDWGMSGRLRPGYRALFYGPPGTGKTLTAALLGKSTGMPVFRIDLSLVVSKYIGETEKNLSGIFAQAEHRRWILFFDEADALFGKRTETRNAHDRYANQETAYLLQRIESFDGIAILASNMRQNLDDAFLRRFESVIYFPLPRPEERLLLWQQALPAQAALSPDLDTHTLAQRYELSGGAIVNAIRFAALRALDNGGMLKQADLVEGVERELRKEGRG
jgi:hypothetical protein